MQALADEMAILEERIKPNLLINQIQPPNASVDADTSGAGTEALEIEWVKWSEISPAQYGMSPGIGPTFAPLQAEDEVGKR